MGLLEIELVCTCKITAGVIDGLVLIRGAPFGLFRLSKVTLDTWHYTNNVYGTAPSLPPSKSKLPCCRLVGYHNEMNYVVVDCLSWRVYLGR